MLRLDGWIKENISLRYLLMCRIKSLVSVFLNHIDQCDNLQELQTIFTFSFSIDSRINDNFSALITFPVSSSKSLRTSLSVAFESPRSFLIVFCMNLMSSTKAARRASTRVVTLLNISSRFCKYKDFCSVIKC